ncbi:MAG: hypothetical protein OXG57_10970 [Acidimicrobiaceae bacterium]|nr:hypothetical protein [Acidimicrobiaceae bacterium]
MYDSLLYTAPIAAALSAACAAALAAAGTAQKGPRQGRHNEPRRNERGEGVISAAIAVLIIASLGALMWVGFKTLWENAEETTNSEIAKIGK